MIFHVPDMLGMFHKLAKYVTPLDLFMSLSVSLEECFMYLK